MVSSDRIMKKIRFGKSDLDVSEIGLGTLTFGHPTKGIQDFNEIKGILNYALDNGMNFLDTAEEYAGGLCEKYIGEIIKGRGDRENVIIETKAACKLVNLNRFYIVVWIDEISI